jgi:hypothetical protein
LSKFYKVNKRKKSQKSFGFTYSIDRLFIKPLPSQASYATPVHKARITTPLTITSRPTSTTSSLPSPPTPKLTMAFTLTLMAKTRTKSMQLDSVEEILIKMSAVVASMTLRLLSHGFVQIKKRQQVGTTIALCASQTTPYLALKMIILPAFFITKISVRHRWVQQSG